ncbi:RHS repeat protein, partial [Cronobacter muytjensii]
LLAWPRGLGVGFKSHLLLRLDGLKLDYDGFGRLTRRQDKNGVVQHFAYDDEQRVKEIRLPMTMSSG